MKITRASETPCVQIGGEDQAALPVILAYHLLQAGLIYGDLAVVQGVYLARIVVNASHMIAEFGKASAGDQTDITHAHYAKIHLKAFLSK